MATAKEIEKKIIDSLPEIEKIGYDSELIAAQRSLELLFARTFAAPGDGVRDVDNAKLKPYTLPYAKWRAKRGYQIKNKDLQVTGALHESIQVGSSDGRPALGFLTERSTLIATYQEEQQGNIIFSLNAEEVEEVKKTIAEFAINRMSEIVKTWS